MSQYDFGTIDPFTKSGSALASDLNAWRTALHSWHKGSAAPSYLVTGMVWIDDNTTPWVVKMYDGADHITIGYINPTLNTFEAANVGTAVFATTLTGTSVIFSGASGVPANCRRVRIALQSMSTDVSNNVLVQLGDSGGSENTGYVGSYAQYSAAAVALLAHGANAWTVYATTGAGDVAHGIIELTRMSTDGTAWALSSRISNNAATSKVVAEGTKVLTGELTTISLLPQGNFDLGAATVMYN